MARVIEERMNGRTFVVGNTVPVIPVKAASSPALPRDQMG
jgi:hypothetical protein